MTSFKISDLTVNSINKGTCVMKSNNRLSLQSAVAYGAPNVKILYRQCFSNFCAIRVSIYK